MSANLKLTAKELHSLGYFLGAVTKATQDYGVRLDAHGPAQMQGPLVRPRVTREDERQIGALRRSGMAQRAIARTTGRSLQTVQRVLKESGL